MPPKPRSISPGASPLASPQANQGQGQSGGAGSRIKKALFRFSRTFFNFTTVGFPVIGLALLCVAVASGSWATDEDWGKQKWHELNPILGVCSCDDVLQSPCSERQDRFTGAAWLSIAAFVAVAMMCMLQLWELSAYGMYGASHTYSRLIIIGCLVALGSLIFSLAAFAVALLEQHCGLPSFYADGYSFFWAPAVQVLEVILMIVYTIHSGLAFGQTVRGPPSLSVGSLSVIMAMIAVTADTRQWMFRATGTKPGTEYAGLWSLCRCIPPCEAVSSKMMLTMIFSIVSIVFQIPVVYFSALRAVDYQGKTLIHTAVFQVVAIGAQGATLAMYFLGLGDLEQCAPTSVFPVSNYTRAWGFNFVGTCAGLNIVSFITNCIYRCPVCDFCGYEGLSADDNILFRPMWYMQLKDPRVVEYERGGEAEAEMEEEDAAEDEKEKEAKAEEEAKGGAPPATDSPSKVV